MTGQMEKETTITVGDTRLGLPVIFQLTDHHRTGQRKAAPAKIKENTMNFVESRLLGVQIDESRQEVSISGKNSIGKNFELKLHGVEKIIVNDFRQQNIIEDMTHWTVSASASDVALRESVFFLMTGATESDCNSKLFQVALAVIDRVITGELEMLEITAIFGAQVIASFTSMNIRISH